MPTDEVLVLQNQAAGHKIHVHEKWIYPVPCAWCWTKTNPCWPKDIIEGQACYPVTWPSNWEYRCQRGNLHLAERGAIGGDFPV